MRTHSPLFRAIRKYFLKIRKKLLTYKGVYGTISLLKKKLFFFARRTQALQSRKEGNIKSEVL